MRHYCFNIFLIFVFLFSFLFVFIHSANAALILNHPNYTGLNKGLVGFWSFDGKDIAQSGTRLTAIDRSGSGNNASSTLSYLPVKTEGKIGQALNFDDSDDHFSVEDSPTLVFNNQITLSAWIKVRAHTTESQRIFAKGFCGVSDSEFTLRTNSDGTITFIVDLGTEQIISSLSTVAPGVWHHVSGTYDGSNVRVYLDSILDNHAAASGAIDNGTYNLWIGAQQSQAVDCGVGPGEEIREPFNGNLDELRIYNRALSADEIKRLYRIGGTLHVNSGDLGKNDTLQKGLVGWWTFDGKDIAGFPSTATSPGTVYDRSGQGNNGLYYNATGTKPVAGKLGQALSFDGVNDFVDAGSGSVLDDITEGTVILWFKVNNSSTNKQVPIAKDDAGNNTGDWALEIINSNDATNPNKIAVFKVSVPGFQFSNTAVSFGAWTHVAITFRSNDTQLMYVNGVLQSDIASGSDVMPITNAAATLIQGARRTDNAFFNGLIDDVRIYNRALSADEIKRLYKIGGTLHVNSGDLGKNDTLQKGLVGYWSFDGKDVALGSGGVLTAYDKSGNQISSLGTTTNGIPTLTFGKIGQAANFDGVNDYMEADNALLNVLPGNFAASFWVNPAGAGLLMAADYCGTDAGYSIWNTRAEPGGAFSFRLTGSASVTITSAAHSFNAWHHVVAVRKGTQMILYVDGVQEATGSEPADVTTGLIHLYFGARGWSFTDPASCGTSFLNGKIDEARLYNRALTADEIKRLYNLGR